MYMTMVTDISNGVKISVVPRFQEEYSRPTLDYYIFTYHVTIENTNPYPVQLLSRKWVIFDSLSKDRIVEGEGVIGLQPIIQSGHKHSYTSSCDLNSEIGAMSGFYIFKNLETHTYLEAQIPLFQLVVPAKLN